MCPMCSTEHLFYVLYKHGNNLSGVDYFIKFLSAATGEGCFTWVKKPGKEILHMLLVIFRVMQVQLSST